MLESAFARLVELMQAETRDGRRAIDDPVLRDRLVRLQARVVAAKYHSLRMLTCSLKQELPGAPGTPAGCAALVTKLSGCELSHQIAALAIDAMGELGVLYDGSKHERAFGALAVPVHVLARADHRRRHRADPEEHHRGARARDAARAEAGAPAGAR